MIDVVIVSFNSEDHLRPCVEPLLGFDDVAVIVVDNASTDETIASVSDLPITVIARDDNGGFARGCNVGWRSGEERYVLFLNPDARIDHRSLMTLAAVLEENTLAAAAAPRIVHEHGGLDFSQRRFPRLRSTYARALLLHRLFPRASWADEVIRDERAYAQRGSPEWASGACLLVRRSTLEQLGGFDEGFFMYSEDTDLCRRLRDLGHDIVFEPEAIVQHAGGASAPRASLLPVLAASRVRYVRKHRGSVYAALERIGLALESALRAVLGRGGPSARAGHVRALLRVASRAE